MWRSAFTERESKQFLVAIPEHGNPRFLDPMRWFYGGADSDLDTLESATCSKSGVLDRTRGCDAVRCRSGVTVSRLQPSANVDV